MLYVLNLKNKLYLIYEKTLNGWSSGKNTCIGFEGFKFESYWFY